MAQQTSYRLLKDTVLEPYRLETRHNPNPISSKYALSKTSTISFHFTWDSGVVSRVKSFLLVAIRKIRLASSTIMHHVEQDRKLTCAFCRSTATAGWLKEGMISSGDLFDIDYAFQAVLFIVI
mmetsp:Transcript_14267/g.21074  ORF Transcript_14267/g.21074 Transcript_14267/m.21074 type:complete len:123 (-) Transcript_14267:18-386(-)